MADSSRPLSGLRQPDEQQGDDDGGWQPADQSTDLAAKTLGSHAADGDPDAAYDKTKPEFDPE